MPTVLRQGGFRFFFFSNEGTEPAHIHVERGDGHAKYWLDPVSLAVSKDLEGRDLVVRLEDGRTVHVPLDWFPRLRDAKHEDLSDWRLVGRGVGIHWPRLDEDLSVSGLLNSVGPPAGPSGTPAGASRRAGG